MPSSATYYTDTYNGNVFIGSTAVGGVKPPATNATAQTYAIWNPLGSGKNIIPLAIDVGFVDTTSAAGNICLSYQTGMGSQVATGAAVTAATLVAPLNAYLSAGNSSIAKFAPASLTLGAGSTFLMTLGFNQLVTTAATTSAPGWTWHWEGNGRLIVPPGVGIFITGATAVLSNVDIVTYWEEAPTSG